MFDKFLQIALKTLSKYNRLFSEKDVTEYVIDVTERHNYLSRRRDLIFRYIVYVYE